MNRKANPEDVKAVQITIKLTQADKDKLDAIAECSKITQGNVIRALIKKSRPCARLSKD